MASTIFFDMDGVLADFVGGSLRAHGKTLPHAECRWDFMCQVGFASGGDPAFWSPLSNPDFWANLDPLPDGLALFARAVAAFGADRVGILSSGLCPGSCDGKREWLRRHLPGLDRRAVFCTEKHLCAAPCKVLVDDHDPNVAGFLAPPTGRPGGRAVLVPRPWNRRADESAGGRFDTDAIMTELHAAVRAASGRLAA
jgi:5'(3')-deoxyribonucleotidase